MRLIDGDYVRDEILYGDAYVSDELAVYIKRVFDKAPAIDPESLRKRGEWVSEHETWGKMQCSICKKEALLEKANGDVGQILLYVTSNFCPNCGTCMKGAGDNA